MPTYDITVEGAVQDVGFRDLVATLGRTHGLPGYVYNEPADTVRIVTRGDPAEVEAFVRGIREESERAGIAVADIEREETDESLPVPSTFFKAPTDELSDIGEKLDEGIGVLRDIKEDTAVISDIKEDTAVISDIKEDTSAIKEDTSAIKEDTSAIKKDSSAIKEDTSAIKEDTSAIKEDTAEISGIKSDTGRLVEGQRQLIELLEERL